MDEAGHRVVVHADRRLAGELERLATRRMVFFAGLPGTGKSLLVHQLTHLAAARHRRLHLLQWDVARPLFEASPSGRRYPLSHGVTHAVIRKAVGLWVRRALADWNVRYPEAEHLLVGETPFVGNRLVELARPAADDAEALLSATTCRFAIVVPSLEVRRFLESERERRAESPLHPREREDAPPELLRHLWRELAEVAGRLGFPSPASYDPRVYRSVYEQVLRWRYVDVVPLDVILPTRMLSVYDFGVSPIDLVPTEAEADIFIREVERRYADPGTLEREVARWWDG